MDHDDISRAMSVAAAAATAVSPYLLEGFRAATEVQLKGPIDLVTAYDVGAEARLREALSAALPYRIVGEESGTSGDPGSGAVWYVDPIDGTTNFAHGHPFFCVSIGLYDDDGVSLAGVIHAPALGVTWVGGRGHGVSRNGIAVGVSARATLNEALCATGFPYDRREAEDDNLREFGAVLKRVRGIRRCGSAALDLALVADGTYDAYWEQRLAVWDMAAGAALVEAAGGRLSDYDGGPADVRQGRVVASNGRVHDALVAVLMEARSGR
ncbi:MAG: inositol monophosphatase family protein [Polyangiales bacterium]